MNYKICTSVKRKILMIIGVFVFTLIFIINSVKAQDGEQLFQQCRACHTIGQGKLVGPDLLGVSKTKDAAWLKKFIRSSQTMVKNGDPQALEIYEEFNKLMMIDYNLTDNEIEAIIKYIDSFSLPDSGETLTSASADSIAAAENAEYLASIDTDENEAKGKSLFLGNRKFTNGGATCVSCHHVNSIETMQGGLLAKDLTNSFSRIGGLAGIKGIIDFPPYPAMKDAYKNAPITETESVQLQVFLMRADKINKAADSSKADLIKKGFLGVLILLAIIYLVWYKRKKRSVNYQIIRRQKGY